ncbi:MAG: adenylate/guanylate cyclase domain-containing protein [Bauldia sp.]|nr:adenylate/guanylate cyclase domain-containing protein [Bauldia sp.]
MPEPITHQRLAAILFADIAGYTTLMEADEAGTYAAWRSARTEAVLPVVEQFHGRVVKFTGDGFLADFPAAEAAVSAALRLQEAFAGRAPLRLRIGIHLGDVYSEGGDVYGDGVNIAARLEGVAEPGGVCISGTVHDLVRKRVPADFVDGGRVSLKHVAEPLQVWHVWPRTGTNPAPHAEAGRATGPGPIAAEPDGISAEARRLLAMMEEAFRRPRIAVLPFQNMSQDGAQDYFADGLAEDLITELSRTGVLFVAAWNATSAFKGQAVDVTRVATELGVGFVLEGSVRRSGSRVRVTAQLIDAASGGHIWAERFDRELVDVFEVQDEITRSIVNALSLTLSPHADRNVGRRSTHSVEAYDLFLRARELLFESDRPSNEKARPLLEQAIAIDPAFASAYAGLAEIHMIYWLNQWSDDPDRECEQALAYAEAAVRLNPRDPYAYWSLAGILIWRRDFERSLALSYRALELDPAILLGYNTAGSAMLGLGRAEDALAIFDSMSRVGWKAPSVHLHFIARALFLLGRYDEVATVLRQRIAMSPETDVSRALLAATFGHLGRTQEARAVWEELFRTNPAYSLEFRRQILSDAEFSRMLEGLRKAAIKT